MTKVIMSHVVFMTFCIIYIYSVMYSMLLFGLLTAKL